MHARNFLVKELTCDANTGENHKICIRKNIDKLECIVRLSKYFGVEDSRDIMEQAKIAAQLNDSVIVITDNTLLVRCTPMHKSYDDSIVDDFYDFIGDPGKYPDLFRPVSEMHRIIPSDTLLRNYRFLDGTFLTSDQIVWLNDINSKQNPSDEESATIKITKELVHLLNQKQK
jgi:hypothetical protein